MFAGWTMIYLWKRMNKTKRNSKHFIRFDILKFNWFLLSLWFLLFFRHSPEYEEHKQLILYFEIYFYFWIDASSSFSLLFCLFLPIRDIWLFPCISSRWLCVCMFWWDEISNFCNPLHYVRVYFYVAVVHPSEAVFFKATCVSIHTSGKNIYKLDNEEEHIWKEALSIVYVRACVRVCNWCYFYRVELISGSLP